MIDKQKAIEIARTHFQEHGSLTVTRALENDSMWIFFAGNEKSGQVACATHVISVDKQTGEISNFRMPSRESFEILKSSKKVELQ